MARSLNTILTVKLRVVFKFCKNGTVKCAANVFFLGCYMQLICVTSKSQGCGLPALFIVPFLSVDKLVCLVFLHSEQKHLKLYSSALITGNSRGIFSTFKNSTGCTEKVIPFPDGLFLGGCLPLVVVNLCSVTTDFDS